MKKLLAMVLFGATLSAVALESGAVTIQSPWGPRTHRPNALLRAMSEHTANTCKNYPDACAASVQPPFNFKNRLIAASYTIKLPEVVSASIDHDSGGNVVITLVDVDGNTSSIWTSGKELKNQKPMPVTGVEPY